MITLTNIHEQEGSSVFETRGPTFGSGQMWVAAAPAFTPGGIVRLRTCRRPVTLVEEQVNRAQYRFNAIVATLGPGALGLTLLAKSLARPREPLLHAWRRYDERSCDLVGG
jgi:hypothetical protein